MNSAITGTNFFHRTFFIGECRYKVVITAELNPITCKATGVYVGTFISSFRGTRSFKYHKDRIEKLSNLDLLFPGITNELYNIIKELAELDAGYAEEFLPAAGDTEPSDNFTLEEFTHKGVLYKMVYTPELFGGLEDLDVTGLYLITLISSSEGTRQFTLAPDNKGRLMAGDNARSMDSDLLETIDRVIRKITKKH